MFQTSIKTAYFIPEIQSRRFDFLDFAFSGHVFHVDKLRYTIFKNRICQEKYVGHVGIYLHMKGGYYSEKNRYVFDICSKMTFYKISKLILDFKKLHKVFMCVFLFFGK